MFGLDLLSWNESYLRCIFLPGGSVLILSRNTRRQKSTDRQTAGRTLYEYTAIPRYYPELYAPYTNTRFNLSARDNTVPRNDSVKEKHFLNFLDEIYSGNDWIMRLLIEDSPLKEKCWDYFLH